MVLTALTLLSGCAMNLAELRSARVLRAGEMQVTQGNNIVVPTSGVVESWNTALLIAETQDNEVQVTEEQALDRGSVRPPGTLGCLEK